MGGKREGTIKRRHRDMGECTSPTMVSKIVHVKEEPGEEGQGNLLGSN